jgi:hypothetical protein
VNVFAARGRALDDPALAFGRLRMIPLGMLAILFVASFAGAFRFVAARER